MSFVWEFIGVWREQYFAMIRIQFPEIFRSAILIVYGFVSSLPITKFQRDVKISKQHYDDIDHTVDRVECEVLYDPPAGTRSADVIIIHGLHGSTYKTWRQGIYECNKNQKVPLRRSVSTNPKIKANKLCSKCKQPLYHQNKRPNKTSKENQDSKNLDEDAASEKRMPNYPENVKTVLGDNDISRTCDSYMLWERFNIFSCYKKRNSNVSHNGISELSEKCDNKFSQLETINNSWNEKVLHNNNCDSKIGTKFSLFGFYFNSKSKDECNNDKAFIDILEMDMKDNERKHIEDVDKKDTTQGCVCLNGKENNVNCNSEEYIKYCDVYGNFFLDFLLSFARELYSLYRRILSASEEKELSPCWPRDWIPIDCPQARVISINYTTFLWMPIWTKPCNRTSLQEKSLEMARQLEKLGVGNKPIVWAAHSKGGLYIKQIFVNSWRGYEGISRDLFFNTHTLVFYSVPQHGSVLAHFFTPPLVKPSIEIVEIRTGSQMVQRLQNEFREALQAAHENKDVNSPPIVVSYTETIPTSMSGILLQIVFPTSADPGVGELYGIPLDHRMICKFASRDSVLYKDFVKMIETACNNNCHS